jgi:hypothetical protein
VEIEHCILNKSNNLALGYRIIGFFFFFLQWTRILQQLVAAMGSSEMVGISQQGKISQLLRYE